MPEQQNATVQDYIAGDHDLPTTAMARWEANIRAIRTLKELEAEGRPATPPEQAILAQFSGFGDSAFESSFRPNRPWQEGAERTRWETLREVTTDEELSSLGGSRVNAFYTNPEIIRSMWKGLDEMGAGDLDSLRVLEPSAGSGRFLTYQPEHLARKSERTAVELDSLTGRILDHVHPATEVWQSGFEQAPLPDNHYDIAISNVPFGSYAVHDPEYIRTGRKYLTQQGIHNYFFAKTLDKLKPGGVLAFITTHGTLDSPTRQEAREYFADQADLVGAVRLPEDIFPDTQVVTDIIYLRKRKEGEEPGDNSWVESGKLKVPTASGELKEASVNRYFLDNPDRVLGKHSGMGSMYRDDSYTVKSDTDPATLQDNLETMVEDIADSPLPSGGPVLNPGGLSDTGPTGSTTFRGEGMYRTAPDGTLEVQKMGQMVPASLPAAKAARVVGMVELRDTATKLMDMESSNGDEAEIETARGELKDQYDRFVKKYGLLNSKANRALMRDDPGASTVAALETPVRGSEDFMPAAVLTKRVIGQTPEPVVGSSNDAMLITLNETGRLDFDHMAQQLGETPETVRANLERDQLIFRNPLTGSYETANTYLTGDVREKFRAAKLRAAQDPQYNRNVAALEEVLPPKVEAHEIVTPVGAPWIPQELVNQWAYEHLTRGMHHAFRPQEHGFYSYNPDNGQWYQPRTPNLDYARAMSEFGTRDMGGDDILLAMLQGKSIKVTRKDPDTGAQVMDADATTAVQEKARAIQKSFSEWLWQDEKRKEFLVEKYNDLHNSVRPRLFDGSHQTFPGMAEQWQRQMREHQADAIYRTVHDGTALLAHEVGFGKTAVMVAAAMERKRLGLTNKAVFVVPKATHKQFAQQFLEIYPNAKLLTPDNTDFEKKRRQTFLNRMATGDWDGIILTSEQFEKIPVSPELEHRWVLQQKQEFQQALEFMRQAHEGSSRKGRQKDLETKIKNFEARLRTLREEMTQKTDDGSVRHFDKMGIDQIVVDEADRYKNLQLHTQMGEVKGMPGAGSQRALDMLMKVRHVQEQGGPSPAGFSRNGVVFATGTPIANTIAEAWTMMRYLQLPELRKRGLHHFDAWAKTYGEVTEGLEATPQGTYKNTQRFAKFVNLPELSQLFQNVADIRVASEVPEMLEAQPCLIDETGNNKRTTVAAPNHEALRSYMGYVRRRVDNLGRVHPKEDNMLKISTDARKAALDIRMVVPDAPPNPRGKIPMAAEIIADNFQKEKENFGTQLVFLDYGTPKSKDKNRETPEGAADETLENTVESADELQDLSNLYALLKRDLTAKGVTANQIAFVHDAKTDEERKKMFRAVNNGDIRILVGSTEKIGVGVNVQERAYAAHHLDVPWRPRDIEQREGRIIRQGNKVYGPIVNEGTREVLGPGKCVKIYQYVQEGSFDEFMWQAVEVKANAIKSLMRRHVNSRSADDIDSIVLSAGEARALASGNPLVLEREKLRNQVRSIRLALNAHRTQKADAETQLGRLAHRIEGIQNSLPSVAEDAALVKGLPEDAPFNMTVGQTAYDKRADAGQALETALNRLPMTFDLERANFRQIGQYKGFDVRAIQSDRGWQVQVVNPATDNSYPTGWLDELNPTGLTSRLDNVIKSIPGRLDYTQQELANAQQSVITYQEQARRPFDQGSDLQEAQRQLAQVQAQMAGQEQSTEETNDSDLVEDLLADDLGDYMTIDMANDLVLGDSPSYVSGSYEPAKSREAAWPGPRDDSEPVNPDSTVQATIAGAPRVDTDTLAGSPASTFEPELPTNTLPVDESSQSAPTPEYDTAAVGQDEEIAAVSEPAIPVGQTPDFDETSAELEPEAVEDRDLVLAAENRVAEREKEKLRAGGRGARLFTAQQRAGALAVELGNVGAEDTSSAMDEANTGAIYQDSLTADQIDSHIDTLQSNLALYGAGWQPSTRATLEEAIGKLQEKRQLLLGQEAQADESEPSLASEPDTPSDPKPPDEPLFPPGTVVESIEGRDGKITYNRYVSQAPGQQALEPEVSAATDDEPALTSPADIAPIATAELPAAPDPSAEPEVSSVEDYSTEKQPWEPIREWEKGERYTINDLTRGYLRIGRRKGGVDQLNRNWETLLQEQQENPDNEGYRQVLAALAVARNELKLGTPTLAEMEQGRTDAIRTATEQLAQEKGWTLAQIKAYDDARQKGLNKEYDGDKPIVPLEDFTRDDWESLQIAMQSAPSMRPVAVVEGDLQRRREESSAVREANVKIENWLKNLRETQPERFEQKISPLGTPMSVFNPMPQEDDLRAMDIDPALYERYQKEARSRDYGHSIYMAPNIFGHDHANYGDEQLLNFLKSDPGSALPDPVAVLMQETPAQAAAGPEPEPVSVEAESADPISQIQIDPSPTGQSHFTPARAAAAARKIAVATVADWSRKEIAELTVELANQLALMSSEEIADLVAIMRSREPSPGSKRNLVLGRPPSKKYQEWKASLEAVESVAGQLDKGVADSILPAGDDGLQAPVAEPPEPASVDITDAGVTSEDPDDFSDEEVERFKELSEAAFGLPFDLSELDADRKAKAEAERQDLASRSLFLTEYLEGRDLKGNRADDLTVNTLSSVGGRRDEDGNWMLTSDQLQEAKEKLPDWVAIHPYSTETAERLEAAHQAEIAEINRLMQPISATKRTPAETATDDAIAEPEPQPEPATVPEDATEPEPEPESQSEPVTVRGDQDCGNLLVKRKTRGDGYNILNDDEETIGTIVQQGSSWLIKQNNRRVMEAKTLTAAKTLLDDPEVCDRLLQKDHVLATAGPTVVTTTRPPVPKVKPLIEHPVTKRPKQSADRSGATNRGKGIARIKRRIR